MLFIYLLLIQTGKCSKQFLQNKSFNVYWGAVVWEDGQQTFSPKSRMSISASRALQSASQLLCSVTAAGEQPHTPREWVGTAGVQADVMETGGAFCWRRGRPCSLHVIWRWNTTFEVSVYFRIDFFETLLTVTSYLVPFSFYRFPAHRSLETSEAGFTFILIRITWHTFNWLYYFPEFEKE